MPQMYVKHNNYGIVPLNNGKFYKKRSVFDVFLFYMSNSVQKTSKL